MSAEDDRLLPEEQQALPGLEEPTRPEAEIVAAARRSLRALEAVGLLDERHAVLCQQMIELAKVIDAGRRSGRASAVAMAAAQLLATYQAIVPESEGGDNDEWSELVAEFRRSAPEIRDQA